MTWMSFNPLRADMMPEGLMFIMPIVIVTMHECSPDESTRQQLHSMHHADPSRSVSYLPHRVGMMHECSTGELLMHYADKRA